MTRRVVALIFLLGSAISGHSEAGDRVTLQDYEPREGDIIFQSFPDGALARAIEGVTQSSYSHCGIVTGRGHMWMVLEAVGPVKETPLASWIMRGKNQSFDVYRLKPEYSRKIPEFVAKARAYRGRPYDIQYEFDDEKVYCSELVFKAFLESTGEQLGEVVSLGQLRWEGYEDFIRGITGGELPLERKMITPWHLSRAKQLQPIYESLLKGGSAPNMHGAASDAASAASTR
jgi:cell wall-associated NlpC family hydrolase